MLTKIQAYGDDDPNIATYASLLIAAFTAGEGISSMLWARISDVVGRKPSLLLGNVGAAVFMTMFGFSTSLSWAIFCRFMGGLCNPNIAIVDTMIAEYVSKEHISE